VGSIQWNFDKYFLVSKSGEVSVYNEPSGLSAAIKDLINEKKSANEL
jgi:glutathione peroxidase-family protein